MDYEAFLILLGVTFWLCKEMPLVDVYVYVFLMFATYF